MSYLELSARDREQWNLPERVEFDLNTIGFRSLGAMKKTTGFTLDQAVSLGFSGLIKIVDGKEVVERDDDAYAAILWVILYAAGHRIPWDEFDPKPAGLTLYFDPPEEVDEGKAETDGSKTTEN